MDRYCNSTMLEDWLCSWRFTRRAPCKLAITSSFLLISSIVGCSVIHVLYHLQFLSEQAPFDAATFSYTYCAISRYRLGETLLIHNEGTARTLSLLLYVPPWWEMKPTSDQLPHKPSMSYKKNTAQKQLIKLSRLFWKHCDNLEKVPELRFKL
jgi:hypothetical protein